MEDPGKTLSFSQTSTALEAESKLRGLVRTNRAGVRAAFAKGDPKNTRVISVANARRVLQDNWSIVMNEQGAREAFQSHICS